MAENSRIYDQFEEYVDLSGHIEFAESLIAKYEWDKETDRNLKSRLKLIRDKQNDHCLNLSVVGEFSTGKSSFINALLGEDLLKSSVIQGTTVVNTIIEYYDRLILFVKKKNGCHDIKTPDSIEELSSLLSEASTNSETTKGIEMIRVGMPSELLKSGIRIIDTPGTNSTDSWHEDVTKEAIRNLSDLSIVLTDAIHPVSQTLLDFVDANLSDVLNQTAFIVTYFDKLRKRDRQDTLDYICKKLSNELEIEFPEVLPYIAPAVLASRNGEVIMKDQDEMVGISAESRSRLLEILKKNRQISQIKKLLALTKDTFLLLEDNIAQKKTEYDEEYKMLIKSRQTSLEPFVESEKRRCEAEFHNRASDIKDELKESIASRIEYAKVYVRCSITQCNASTADNIKIFMKERVPGICNEKISELSSCLNKSNYELSQVFATIMHSYQYNFDKEFKKLGILKIDMDSLNVTTPELGYSSSPYLKSAMDYMTEAVSNENWAVGSAGVAGAAIGTMFFPGVGTVIGGLIGAFAGAIATPSAEELKKNAYEKLSGPFDSALHTAEREIISKFNDNLDTYISSIKKEIDRYLKQYKQTIDTRIEEHNKLIEKNQQKIEKISADLRLITLRRNQLKSISESLK